MAQEVNILKSFRDNVLLTNSIGKMFVKIYYNYSPPVADFIAKHDRLRAMVRISLLPIVGVIWVALKLGFVATMTLMLFFTYGLIFLVRVRKKFKK